MSAGSPHDNLGYFPSTATYFSRAFLGRTNQARLWLKSGLRLGSRFRVVAVVTAVCPVAAAAAVAAGDMVVWGVGVVLRRRIERCRVVGSIW